MTAELNYTFTPYFDDLNTPFNRTFFNNMDRTFTAHVDHLHRTFTAQFAEIGRCGIAQFGLKYRT